MPRKMALDSDLYRCMGRRFDVGNRGNRRPVDDRVGQMQEKVAHQPNPDPFQR